MNCEHVTIQLDEYLDNELPDPDRRLVEAHLAGCALCAEAYESLERELAMFGQYERPVETGEAMWAAVRARIEPATDSPNVVRGSFGARRFLAPLIAAACLVLVAGIGFVAWRSEPAPPKTASAPNPNPVDEPLGADVPTPQTAPDRAPDSSTSVGVTPVVDIPAPSRAKVVRPAVVAGPAQPSPLPVPVANAERHYIAAIALLRTEIDRTAGADTSVSELARKPLNDLDANIQSARRAVEQNPDDPIAVNSMLSAYDEKVETMQRLVALQARNDR